MSRFSLPKIYQAWFAILLLPLLMASLARPFGWWDYLSALELYLPFGATEIQHLPENYIHNALVKEGFERPTLALLYNLQSIVFGGEFWLWYLVKWAAKLTAAALAVRILARLEVPAEGRWFVAAFVLFHPVSFELMLFSADGWMALAFLGLLLLTVSSGSFNSRPFDITAFSRGRYGAVLACWFLGMGIKESAILFAAPYVAMLQWGSRGSPRPAWLRRMAPFYLLLAVWIWRLITVTRVRAQWGKRTYSFDSNVMALVSALLPNSPLFLVPIVTVALCVFAVVSVIRARDRASIAFSLLAGGAGASILIASCINLEPAARYVIPVAYLLAILMGLAFRYLPARAAPAVAALTLLYPLFQAGSLYSQALGYQQLFYEQADILAALEQKASEGQDIAMTGQEGDISAEYQENVALFFSKYAPQFYRARKPRKVYVFGRNESPAGRFVLLTSFSPAEIEGGKIQGLRVSQIERIEAFRRGRYGVLEALAQPLDAMDRALKNSPPDYDVGAPWSSARPEFAMVTVRSLRSANEPSSPADSEPTPLILYRVDFDKNAGMVPMPWSAGQVLDFRAAAESQQPLLLRIPLQPGVGPQRIFVRGQVHVRSGEVYAGITDDAGGDLWNTPLRPSGDWQPFPTPPAVSFGTDRPYFVFIFVPGRRAAEFRIKDLAIPKTSIPFVVLEPSRRFGALSW